MTDHIIFKLRFDCLNKLFTGILIVYCIFESSGNIIDVTLKVKEESSNVDAVESAILS